MGLVLAFWYLWYSLPPRRKWEVRKYAFVDGAWQPVSWDRGRRFWLKRSASAWCNEVNQFLDGYRHFVTRR